MGALLLAAGFLGPRLDPWLVLALAALPLALLAFMCSYATRVYFYDYRFVFSRTKVFRSPFPGEGSLHAKLVLVDDVAFLGSMNFTHMGLVRNLESCVRLSDPVSVAAAVRQADELFSQGSGVEPHVPAGWLFPEPPHRPPR